MAKSADNLNNINISKVLRSFPQSFINENNEMIVFRETNTYFLLDNIKDDLELDCKILEYCSREALKGVDPLSRHYHSEGIVAYFDRYFDLEELEAIYTHLGNGINRELCKKFIQSNFDFELLGIPNKLRL